MEKIRVSNLGHTWLVDIDGTILKHNGHLSDRDMLLSGVLDFWRSIPDGDIVVILSAREEKYKKETELFLAHNGLKYDYFISDLPKGERVVVNDTKPKGLKTALALNVARDVGLQDYEIVIDDKI